MVATKQFMQEAFIHGRPSFSVESLREDEPVSTHA